MDRHEASKASAASTQATTSDGSACSCNAVSYLALYPWGFAQRNFACVRIPCFHCSGTLVKSKPIGVVVIAEVKLLVA